MAAIVLPYTQAVRMTHGSVVSMSMEKEKGRTYGSQSDSDAPHNLRRRRLVKYARRWEETHVSSKVGMSNDTPGTRIVDLTGVLELALELFSGFFGNVFREHASLTRIRTEGKRWTRARSLTQRRKDPSQATAAIQGCGTQ